MRPQNLFTHTVSTPTILYLVTEDWYFWSHRLDLARHARDAGYTVVVGTRTHHHRAQIEDEGFRCVEIPFERSLRHPLRDLRAIWRVVCLIRALRPALVHLVALKPILLACLSILCFRKTRYLHAVTGLGYLFAGGRSRRRRLRSFVVAALRTLINRTNSWLVVQNLDDQALLTSLSIGTPQRTCLIAGSGVDTEQFSVTTWKFTDRPLVILPARMLRDKGIEEFVAAARLVKQTYPMAHFALVGPTDSDNPAAISESELTSWVQEGVVEWWGLREDMAAIYARAAIVCLPSYREGFPKALIEAAACGRALIATDVPGCREICRHEQTGLLVALGDVPQLAKALIRLLEHPETRERLGTAARELVERSFSTGIISAETLALYARLIECTL